MSDTSASFWKKKSKSVPGSIKQIYGAQHPPIQEMPPSSGQSTPNRKKTVSGGGYKDSFEAYKNKTDDAWDDGEDDIMITSQLKISLKDVHNTALQVIQNHSASKQAAATGSTSAATNVPNSSLSQSNHPSIRNGQSSSEFSVTRSGDANIKSGLKQEITRVNSRPSDSSSPSATPPSQRRLSSSSLGSSARPGGPGVGVRLRDTPHQWDDFSSSGESPLTDERWKIKMEKFQQLLKDTPNLDTDELKKQSWSGIPAAHRPTTWKLLSGYLPTILDRRGPMLERKRSEYHNFVEQYYQTRNQDFHKETYRQIHIDIPRMSPLIPLFQQEIVQQMFERILYIWAIRHPASGYVQGINDLVTPFFVVFLTEYVTGTGPNAAANYSDVERCDLSQIDKDSLQKLEADCFWCFSKLLDGIQDNYTFAQPGIQMRVNSLKDLISRIDNGLHKHFEQQRVEYLQFSFRWMNNMLMREMPLRCVIRLWDTYLCEVDGFASFHLYVCAAFLTKFSQSLRQEKDFHGLMLMLQNLPTQDWTNEEIGLILSEAYRLKYMFADAPKHFKDTAAPSAH